MNKELQNEWDIDSEDIDSEDDRDIPPAKLQEKIKMMAKKNPKNKVAREKARDPLKYENQKMVDEFDRIVEKIKGDKKSNEYRDHFFPALINECNLSCGVEIGVDKAEFSLHILNKSKIGTYYCVDTWQDDFGSDCKPGYFDKDGNKRFLEAQKTLETYKDKVEMMRMDSISASTKFLPNSLDFCYIDGDHSMEGIYEDLKVWIPKVRIGGVIAGHDYKDGPRSGINDFWGRQLDYKIKTVVDNFCLRHGYPLRIVGGRIISWYFIKNRDI